MAHGSEQSGMATDLVQQAGERTNAVASWLEQREPGHVVDEVTRFARQRPGAFLALAAGAGFLVGRLGRGLKAATTTATKRRQRLTAGPGNASNTQRATPAARVMPPPRTPGSDVPAHTGPRPQRIPTRTRYQQPPAASNYPPPTPGHHRTGSPPPSPGYPQGPSGRDLAP